MIMLVASYRQHPTAHRLAVHRLGLPWTICLLSCCLMFRRHTTIWSAASIADEIASYYIIAGDVGTTHLAAMGSCFDNLVPFLFHTIIQLLEELFIGVEDPRMGYCHGLENAKHGDFGRDRTRWDVERCVDLASTGVRDDVSRVRGW